MRVVFISSGDFFSFAAVRYHLTTHYVSFLSFHKAYSFCHISRELGHSPPGIFWAKVHNTYRWKRRGCGGCDGCSFFRYRICQNMTAERAKRNAIQMRNDHRRNGIHCKQGHSSSKLRGERGCDNRKYHTFPTLIPLMTSITINQVNCLRIPRTIKLA